jgi:hypothetical protein
MTLTCKTEEPLPEWVPAAARLYLIHTEDGGSLRAIARDAGVHASTVMRQIRRFETRRQDPLVDCALGRLRQAAGSPPDPEFKEGRDMTLHIRTASRDPSDPLDEARLNQEALRVLRRMAEPGVIMAVAADMDRAVVLRDGAEGAVRLGCLTGRWPKPSRYASGSPAPSRAGWRAAARGRYLQTESPVAVLARRRGRDGKPFLGPDLVIAAERLREDFEVAQTVPGTTQDWSRFLTAGTSSGASGSNRGHGPAAARERLIAALSDLGPGLGDMALRCCCYLEGLETAEQAMGWSARSGKIVLRIALMRLKRHYDNLGDSAKMIG